MVVHTEIVLSMSNLLMVFTGLDKKGIKDVDCAMHGVPGEAVSQVEPSTTRINSHNFLALSSSFVMPAVKSVCP